MAFVITCVAPITPAWSADAAGGAGLQQNQLMRQQDQNGLQLRMLQQQRSLQSPPAGARARQEVEREAISQQQRQRELQYRQRTEPSPVHPGDGPGIRRTAEERELRQAQEEGKMQLQRFDYELQQRTESRREEKARGEVRPPQPPEPLQ